MSTENADRNYDLICRQYSGTFPNGSCHAGVTYSELRMMTEVTNPIHICMGRCTGCPHYKPYSPGEIAAEEENMKRVIGNNLLAKECIVKKTNGKRGKYGKINCPVCSAPEGMTFSTSEHNGHVTARCVTLNCVDFRE